MQLKLYDIYHIFKKKIIQFFFDFISSKPSNIKDFHYLFSKINSVIYIIYQKKRGLTHPVWSENPLILIQIISFIVFYTNTLFNILPSS